MKEAALNMILGLHRLHQRLTRLLDARLGALHGLSFSDFTLLRVLSLAPARRLQRSELAVQVGLTASGVTRALLPLEKLGLITREANQRDARVSYATLTPAGHQLVQHATLTTEQISQEFLRNMSPEQQKQFRHLIEELHE